MQRFVQKIVRPSCQVFINHRSIDTKRNIAGLLNNELTRMGVRTFLDSMNMKPGDKLFEHIDKAILDCKVGVAVFSPRYCDSHFCLHELALLMESKKRVVPIFYDVKPSHLLVKGNGTSSKKQLQRFSLALEEAKNTVGLTFDSLNGSGLDGIAKGCFRCSDYELVGGGRKVSRSRAIKHGKKDGECFT